ncbi:MAG: hypothetical protein LC739_10690 [Actinobacteria bacterium]|nr:hypothetical protein [Acidimicrobiia bacterium]MCA1736546.1 hypothetical protein [Actinomycetota bacterium]
MAKRGGDAALKRAREKARLEKQEAKREKRQARAADEVIPPGDADALMEEFAQLSASFEASQVTEERFNEERHRIFVALGLQSEDD